MGDWKAWLADVDDDYLTGIANKGIVKRAYKDKEEGNYQVLSLDEEAEVSIGEEKVVIKMPLGESRCSCPSRSICRHVILGILALKEKAGASGQEQTECGQITTMQDLCQETQTQGRENVLASKLMEEIGNFPDASVQKVLGSRQLQGILEQKKASQVPLITYSSVITVELAGMGQTVKLLSPLEHSSCTCHKKDFCIHKAVAILWCKLEKGLVRAENLEGEDLGEPPFDRVQIKETALQMKNFLEELIHTGLARVSPDILDQMERFATISHNVRLAEFEGYFRALQDSYRNYFDRKASFRTQTLMEQFSRLYRRVELLLDAESDGEIAELAGEFKAEYLPAGTLDLTGIAIEHFESQTGYEGETVYFLEENTKEWYTYTWARPVFYEDAKRRGRQEKAKAPWGIPLSLEGMAQARMKLTGARCDCRRRLSSSQETKGELIESRGKEKSLHVKELGGWYYRDFGKLFTERIGSRKASWLKKQEDDKRGMELVFLRPASFQKAVFSETEQKLYMSLYDENGKEIVIETPYSKKEAWGIRYLERIKEESRPCFLGKIYLLDGRIRMYPVAVFEKGEVLEDGNGK
ncbi:MAG: SWIM zinc finger family protein [Lachnospiraceae bacterium]|nr:SWIM zinc finger family protein [Lachnospiraceae bacterium]